MAEQTININGGGGVPVIELRFGFAQFGKYEIYLWDSNGKNPQLIGRGVNIDQVPDRFPIGDVSVLDGRIVTWQAIIASPTGGSNDLYDLTAIFTQDGKNLEDGPFTKPQPPGKLDGVKIVFDQVRLRVG
ncbi:MAG: hypothetical protein H0T60_16295 [Acidobacteria bacterium]|nr:hypothetical protein [Acidobacteriota bacterium]